MIVTNVVSNGQHLRSYIGIRIMSILQGWSIVGIYNEAVLYGVGNSPQFFFNIALLQFGYLKCYGCSLDDFTLTKILKTSHNMAMIQILEILKHGIHQWNLHWAIWAGHLVDKVGIGGFGQVVGRQKGATAILLRYNKVSMLFITSHLARESFPFQIWVDCICFFNLLVLHICITCIVILSKNY